MRFEIAEGRCGDIEGETVGGDPAADVDADGGEFFFGDLPGGWTQMPVLPGDAVGADARNRRRRGSWLLRECGHTSERRADGIEIQDGGSRRSGPGP